MPHFVRKSASRVKQWRTGCARGRYVEALSMKEAKAAFGANACACAQLAYFDWLMRLGRRRLIATRMINSPKGVTEGTFR
eukprot:3463588-Pleurochrysis_carterae.AAC.1